MVFRWFRQNKKATKWLYIGVTIFVMVTFTVTGAMLDGLADKSGEEIAGRFVTKGGETIEVKRLEFRALSQQLSRMGRGSADDEGVWQFIMLERLANEAGVRVGDDVNNEYLRKALEQGGITSDAQYRQFLANFRMSKNDFEEMMRANARINIYQQLADDPPRILSEAVYDKFKVDHEEFSVEYVAFADADIAAGLDADAVSEEDLRTFYDDEMNAVRKANDFFTEAKYGVEAAILDLETADAEAMRASLPEAQRTVEDAEISSFYERNLDRWLIKKDEATDEADPENATEVDEPSDDEESDDEESDDEEADDVVDYRELEDVRGEIEKELLAGRVVNTATGEYNSEKFARDTKKQAEETTDETTDENGEPKADPPADEETDLLVDIATKYGLNIVDYGDPVVLADLESLDGIGGPDLATIQSLSLDGVRPCHPTPDRRLAAVVRLKSKIDAEAKSFDEVKAELPEVWSEETAKKRAEEAATAFWDGLTAKARAAVQDEIAKLETEAKEIADALIEKDAVVDEEKKTEILDREMDSVQPRIDALLAPHRGEQFAAVVEEQGLSVATLDWFRKSYRNTAFYRDDENSAAKFLRGHFPLYQVAIGDVTGPIRDELSGTSVIARVVDRRFPAPEAMRLIDRSNAERQVQQEIDPQWYMRQFGRASTFDFATLSQELRLERFEPKRAEEETESEEPSN